MNQHTVLTLEKKILPPLLPGFELATFRSRVRRSTNLPLALTHISVFWLKVVLPLTMTYISVLRANGWSYRWRYLYIGAEG